MKSCLSKTARFGTPTWLFICTLAIAMTLSVFSSRTLAEEERNYSDAGDYTFSVPERVREVVIEAWGGGGAGGSAITVRGASGGGGGGAYARSRIPVAQGDELVVTVGAGGVPGEAAGDSRVVYDSQVAVLADAGENAETNTNSGVPGGRAGRSVGNEVKYSGGNGADGTEGRLFGDLIAGGGGSSAGTSRSGRSGSGSAGGAAPSGGGGDGGNGSSTEGTEFGDGFAGAKPGGGGGGATRRFWVGGDGVGGAGADGLVRITYNVLPLCTATYSSSNGINPNLPPSDRLNLSVFDPRNPQPWPGSNLIPAGLNVYSKTTISGNDTNVSIGEKTTVLVDGDLTITGNNFTLNQGGNPEDLLLLVDGDFTITKNGAEIAGYIYVTGDINFGNNTKISGLLAAHGGIDIGKGSSAVDEEEGFARLPLVDFGGACIPEESPSDLDHIRILHPSSGLTCTPATDIQVRACGNSSCSELFNEPVTVSLSPAVGWIPENEISFTGASPMLGLRSVDAGVVSLGVSGSTVSAIGDPPVKCYPDGSAVPGNCEIGFAESGLLLEVPDHISGQEVEASILAVKAGETDPGQCVPAFTDQKDIEFTSAYQNPTSGTLSVESAGSTLSGNSLSLDFDGTGAASFPLRYRDVGSVLLAARYEGTGDDSGLVMTGQDAFVARPDRFEINVPGNPGEPGVSDGNVFKVAGENFEVEVLALNVLGTQTPNFGRESPREGVDLTVAEAPSTPLPDLPPLDGALGLFGASCETQEGGKACGQFSWPEVGTFALESSLSSGAYLGTEDVIGQTLTYVGRFIPALFDFAIDPGVLSSEPLDTDRTTCTGARSWVYTGEPFSWEIPAQIRISPRNLGGVTVDNYAGTPFQRLASADVDIDPFPVEDETRKGVDDTALQMDGIFDSASLTPDTSGNLIYTFSSGDEFTYPKSRNARVTGYTPKPRFGLENIEDQDGVSVGNPAADLPEAFVPQADFEIRYGRIVLDNGYGPENMDLVIPLKAEVYGSTGFELHEDENCWYYDLPEDVTTDYSDSVFESGQVEVVEVADTELTLEGGLPEVSAAVDNRVRLSAPQPMGTESSEEKGIYVELDTGNNWLKDYWDADNPATLVAPYAWGTFGVHRGNDRIIYWREVPQ